MNFGIKAWRRVFTVGGADAPSPIRAVIICCSARMAMPGQILKTSNIVYRSFSRL
jgi:hypothetical protein